MTATTTPTTQSTSSLFSLPYRNRKRSAGPHSSVPPTHVIPGPSPAVSLSSSRPHTPVIPFDKALPPTPLEEPASDDKRAASVEGTAKVSPSPSPSIRIRTRKHSASNSSTSALAHAALGIGLPHASTSFSQEASTIPFMPSSPVSVPLQPKSSLRKVKSSQRLQLRHASDTHEQASREEQLERRRQRGLSFTATSFLNTVGFDGKGKGKEVEATADTIPDSKPLSRKSSFWSKKKASRPSESPILPDTSVLPMPSLPPMLQSSPFDIHEFKVPLSASKGVGVQHSPDPSTSYFGDDSGPSYSSSTATCDESMSAPSSHQVHESQSNRSLESRSLVDPPPMLRPRAQTNTPLLRRLSMGMFSSGELSPATSMRSNVLSQPLSASPLPTTPKAESPVPKPDTDESPENYVTRLKSRVGKAEIAGILASSHERFYAQALRSFIGQFDFVDIPIDVALRKMLMEVGLPRETQQIDRVMEAFASRYMDCNPGIFISEDHPYILAFSLIMLHTDAFNPSNKRKMTKADYIKNTTIPGIPVEVLDCLFDNIVFAPFIYIEDPLDSTGPTSKLSLDPSPGVSLTSPASAVPSISATGSFKIGNNKVDPYYLITNNLLDPLRVDVSTSIPAVNPFTYEGSHGPWDEHKVHDSFLRAPAVDVNVPLAPRTMFGIGSVSSIHLSPIATSSSSSVNSKFEVCTVKITKVGILNRKDDFLESGKKASNRKWRPYSVILTGYQLLLFRGPTWAGTLSGPLDKDLQSLDGPTLTELFRPDESYSLKDAVALYDRTYSKYDHTLRLVLPEGRQILLQANDDDGLNDWIAMINYASTFKSTGVRMRPPGLSGEDVVLTGVAAATSHLHDMQSRSGLRRPRSWDNDIAHDLMDMLSGQSSEKPMLKRRVTSSERSTYDADTPVAPEIEGAEQFKATFDQVKADLAASSWSSSLDGPWAGNGSICLSPSPSATSLHSSNVGLPSRSQIIQTTIGELDAKVKSLQSEVDANLRRARNIAILTPFQKSTRSRLAAAIQSMSKRVTSARIELEKTKCYRDVLRCDLASEGRTWNRSKQVALQAAKETLQSRKELPALDTTIIPTIANIASPQRSAGTSRPTHHPDSSTDDSFYSATDFGLEWPSEDEVKSLDTPHKSTRKPSLSTASSGMSDVLPLRHLSPSSSQRPLSHPETSSSLDDIDDPITVEEEQAEEWNQTRCAQRVSLIHVPSNIGLVTRLRTVDQS